MTSSSMAFQSGASSSSSSSSSPSIHPWNHDVFLSFRGEDTRKNFTAHLYQALDRKGIKTYIDNNLERGKEISSALFKAIEGSMISIIVFSKNYAESRWCLDELLKILDCMETMNQIVLPVFYDVDPSEVRHQKGIFGESFDKLGDKLKDNAKMLKWKVALKRVADLSGFPLADFRTESEFIQEIIQWVDLRMVNQTPLSVAKYPIGIESRTRHIYQHLSIGKNDIIRIVGIFGTGGIGKTTISKDIYNRISSQFEGSCFLKDVRETSKQAGGLIKLQNTLLYDILGTCLDVRDIDRGVNVIRQKLSSKRVLLILDDVDDLVQIEKLAGDRDWFGSGSRIIITTRDQSLLNKSKVDSKHEMMILDDNEALQLFSLHAFEEKELPEDYKDLSKQVTKYAQGLPLALTVLGSYLKGISISQWKSALDKLKRIPNKDIQMILRTSYDGLEDNEKDIFLDIACFFKTERVDYVIKVLDGCGFFPDDGIPRLMDKCLISVDKYRKLRMHDLIQEMGREIVRQESPKEPGKRSRLWFHEDVRSVLEENTVTNKIEGILIDLPERGSICLGSKAFMKMKRLRIFINRNACLSPGPNYLSNELSLLDLDECPLQSMPSNFHGKKLIDFRMRDGLIKELGDGFKPKNLTSMTFRDCNFLEKIPDLSSTPNLKLLIVKSCKSLVEVHDSVGSLENLSLLDFSGCSKLHILPRSLNLRYLCHLKFFLRTMPNFLEMEGKVECSTQLNLVGLQHFRDCMTFGDCNILEKIPDLSTLSLSRWKNLMLRPTAFNGWEHLVLLFLDGCPNIVKKMWDDGQSLLLSLQKLKRKYHYVKNQSELTPPTNSSNGSTALQSLNLQSETNFFPISSFFTSLALLDLSGTEIVSLPTSIKEFVALTELSLLCCEKLEEILELPPNIRYVNVSDCKSLERFPEVSKILEFNGSHIRSLGEITLYGCDKMHENIWNDKVQNPLLWKGVSEYDATLFPENQIPEWLSYAHEFLKDDDEGLGRRRGKYEWEIDIEGPHYLEEISGIVLYAVMFFKHRYFLFGGDERNCMITTKGSNVVCCSRGVYLVNMPGYVVWVGYSNLQHFGGKVLDNLRVQFLLSTSHEMVRFYKSCRVKVVYKNERRANKKRKMDEETTKLVKLPKKEKEKEK